MANGRYSISFPTPKPLFMGTAAALLCTLTLNAGNWADRIGLSGFATAKYQQLDEDNFFNGGNGEGVGKDGSWYNTKFGINITAPVDEKISVAAQLFATHEDDFNMVLDWGFISYSLTDEVSLRSGKIKFPVGIVNEYIDVGNTYPWINPPELFYTEIASGPNVTREAYTGASALWETEAGETEIGIDLFGGEIGLESMNLKKLLGMKIRLDWDDIVAFQATYYRGTMRDTAIAAMEGKIHSNIALGLNFDWNDLIGYAEWAKTDMELEAMNGTSWYATLGYQMDEWLPHLTFQHFSKGKDSATPQEQEMVTAGVRYDISDSSDLKVEYSRIKTKKGKGLFANTPVDDTAGRFGIAIDVVF